MDLGSGNPIDQLGRDENQLAKYILLFMVQGLTSNLCFPVCHYATGGITAEVLYPLTWEVIGILEGDIGLKVLCITCDGASPNRKFFKLHQIRDTLTYYTVNPYDPERNIYFVSDVPHLLKTARNCFSNSRSHLLSRNLWKNGKDISWMHVVDLYRHFCTGVFRLCPRIKEAHVHLTSFSRMNVSLAAQVLSKTVATAMEMKYRVYVSETVCFIRIINKWFDILNVRNLQEGQTKRNPNLAPFTDVNDARLQWLVTDFLNYFDEWKHDVENRVGDYSRRDISKMQLSYQTLQGFIISSKSIVACVRYLLDSGADFVLTRAFNQDKIEQYFGLLRMKGGANDNPNVHVAGHLINRMRFVRTNQFQNVRGNARAGIERVIDDQQLPRRRRDR